MRVGLGYDVHKFDKDRELIIGGVNIPYDKGLLGHSDADVLVHAIMDGLLGALGERDIGYHFPDTDPEYKDISSLELLSRVKSLLDKKSYSVVNIDSVVMAERPKLLNYIEEMEENIARVLEIDKSLINIKATTTEKLGFVGREEGIAAQSVCLLKSNKLTEY